MDIKEYYGIPANPDEVKRGAKSFDLPGKFTALNGTVQYYTVVFTNVVVDETKGADDAAKLENRANFLRALETLRTIGGQPIVTKVDNKTIKFTLEQANVYGDRTKVQPSAKDYLADAKADIEALFANLKAVDGTTPFACTATVEAAF